MHSYTLQSEIFHNQASRRSPFLLTMERFHLRAFLTHLFLIHYLQRKTDSLPAINLWKTKNYGTFGYSERDFC